MILLDSNLLVYAHVSSMEQHAVARQWLETTLSGPGRVGLPWPTLLGFVRLVSNPRIFPHPVTVGEAWRRAQDWLRLEVVWIPLPTKRHVKIVAQLMPLAEGRPNLVPDLHLAALAIEHGLELHSTDGDFARFNGLRWLNPLA